MAHPRIRPLVIALFQHDEQILVSEGYDEVKQQAFYRPLGGAIEFGEYSDQALRREINEELGLRITNLRYLFTLENVFIYNGQPGHEIVLVYDADFNDPAVYAQPSLAGIEHGASDDPYFIAVWRSIAYFAETGAPPLYPDGLLERLRA